MKRFKLIVNSLLIAITCLFIYFVYAIVVSKNIPLKESISAFYSLFLCLNLLSFKFNMMHSGRIAKLDSLSIALVLLFSTLMYVDRSYVDSLWHITIILFIFQSGRLLYRIIPENTLFSIISRWAVVIAVGSMEYLILFEKSSPLFFTVSGSILVLLSIVIVIGFFVKPLAN